MSYLAIVESEQRLAICQLLEQNPDYAHNEHVIKSSLALTGLKMGSDLLRNHANWLEEQGLVTVDRELPHTWVIKLTVRGQDAAQGSTRIEGVARPRPS